MRTPPFIQDTAGGPGFVGEKTIYKTILHNKFSGLIVPEPKCVYIGDFSFSLLAIQCMASPF